MDFSKLLMALKAEGLVVAEDAAEKILLIVLDWLEREVVASENKYDDLLLAVIPAIKPSLLKAIDKIDGVEDAE